MRRAILFAIAILGLAMAPARADTTLTPLYTVSGSCGVYKLTNYYQGQYLPHDYIGYTIITYAAADYECAEFVQLSPNAQYACNNTTSYYPFIEGTHGDPMTLPPSTYHQWYVYCELWRNDTATRVATSATAMVAANCGGGGGEAETPAQTAENGRVPVQAFLIGPAFEAILSLGQSDDDKE